MLVDLSVCKLRRIILKLNVNPLDLFSLWVIHWTLHINKIHKNNNSFLIRPFVFLQSKHWILAPFSTYAANV